MTDPKVYETHRVSREGRTFLLSKCSDIGPAGAIGSVYWSVTVDGVKLGRRFFTEETAREYLSLVPK